MNYLATIAVLLTFLGSPTANPDPVNECKQTSTWSSRPTADEFCTRGPGSSEPASSDPDWGIAFDSDPDDVWILYVADTREDHRCVFGQHWDAYTETLSSTESSCGEPVETEIIGATHYRVCQTRTLRCGHWARTLAASPSRYGIAAGPHTGSETGSS